MAIKLKLTALFHLPTTNSLYCFNYFPQVCREKQIQIYRAQYAFHITIMHHMGINSATLYYSKLECQTNLSFDIFENTLTVTISTIWATEWKMMMSMLIFNYCICAKPHFWVLIQAPFKCKWFNFKAIFNLL